MRNLKVVKIVTSERNYSEITERDLRNLLAKSIKRLDEYFIHGRGKKWLRLYDIKKPLCVALCQGVAMHYVNKENGIKDFDIWFFYPFTEKHLPYRTMWNWDYKNPTFGKHPDMKKFSGRKVDVIVRTLKKYYIKDPIKTLITYLEEKQTTTAKELAKKAIVILKPEEYLGKIIWYKNLKNNPISHFQK